MICQNCGYDDNGTGDFAHACTPLNLSDSAVQKRLAAQWGYVPAQSVLADAIIDDLQTQYDTDDVLIKLADTIATVKDLATMDREQVINELRRFATLIAAAEREACAEVCTKLLAPKQPLRKDPGRAWIAATLDCAAAIRERGKE